mmetsp:Transcript_12866/g.42643  ORF Transcript_12866/g.42643 Transcript_12866/m.42643 type:complete len:115 (-) Transcript_12866:995-1339(-)
MTTVLELAYSSPSLSQAGFIDLQWPHQGARNLTNADLPDSTTSVSKFLAVRSTAPAFAPSTRPAREMAMKETFIILKRPAIFSRRGCRGWKVSRVLWTWGLAEQTKQSSARWVK